MLQFNTKGKLGKYEKKLNSEDEEDEEHKQMVKNLVELYNGSPIRIYKKNDTTFILHIYEKSNIFNFMEVQKLFIRGEDRWNIVKSEYEPTESYKLLWPPPGTNVDYVVLK